MTSRGMESALALGVLVVLAAVAAVVSIVTAPPVAEQQVRVGAGATAGVGSFVMHLDNSVTTRAPGSVSPQVQSSQAVVVYQAPDRIQISGNGSAEVVLAGDLRFQRSSNGRWVQLPSIPDAGESYIDGVVLVPATTFSKAEDVKRYGTSSVFQVGSMPPAELDTLLGVYFRVPLSVIRAHAFLAGIGPEYMTGQQMSAAAGNQVDTFTIRYSDLGTAPPVTIPQVAATR